MPSPNDLLDALRTSLTPAPPLRPRTDSIGAQLFPVTPRRVKESIGRNVDERIEGVQGLAQFAGQLPNMTSPEVLSALKRMTDGLVAQATRNLVGTMTQGADFLKSEIARDPAGPAFEVAELLPVGRLSRFKKVGGRNLWELSEKEAVTYAAQPHSQVNRVARTATDKRIGHLKGKMPRDEYRKLSKTIYEDEYTRAIAKAKKVGEARRAEYLQAVEIAREQGLLAVPAHKPLSEAVKDPVNVPEFEGFTRFADNVDKPGGIPTAAKPSKTPRTIKIENSLGDMIERPESFVRFGDVPRNRSGAQIGSKDFFMGRSDLTEQLEGVSTFSAWFDPQKKKYVIKTNRFMNTKDEVLRLSRQNRPTFELSGEALKKLGPDEEVLLKPGTISKKKISLDDMVFDFDQDTPLSSYPKSGK